MADHGIVPEAIYGSFSERLGDGPTIAHNAKARDSMRRFAMQLMAVPQPPCPALAACPCGRPHQS